MQREGYLGNFFRKGKKYQIAKKLCMPNFQAWYLVEINTFNLMDSLLTVNDMIKSKLTDKNSALYQGW